LFPHDPVEADSVCPCTSCPLIVGGAVFQGDASRPLTYAEAGQLLDCDAVDHELGSEFRLLLPERMLVHGPLL
jgi:hypothetical protein